MDRRASRASLAPPLDGRRKSESSIDMEAGGRGARWAIPRPSLAAPPRAAKQRGSASSQGSSSTHSTHSASSGSLLLSAANLAKVGGPRPSSRLSHSSPGTGGNYESNLSAYVQAAPPLDAAEHPQTHSDPFWSHVKLASAKNQRRDLKDAESVASSTHFTVVNGFTRHGRSQKGDKQMWCCKSSHQITVLVVTMTVLFTAGILAAICYVEMRQRREGGSRFS